MRRISPHRYRGSDPSVRIAREKEERERRKRREQQEQHHLAIEADARAMQDAETQQRIHKLERAISDQRRQQDIAAEQKRLQEHQQQIDAQIRYRQQQHEAQMRYRQQAWDDFHQTVQQMLNPPPPSEPEEVIEMTLLDRLTRPLG